MADKVNVMVELHHTHHLGECCAAMMGVADAALDKKVVPDLKEIVWDQGFAPVEIPGRKELLGAVGPRDVSERFEVDPKPESASYLVRGEIDKKTAEALADAMMKDKAVKGVFADVRLEPCPICPGDPPKGTDRNVEKLLCVDRMKECDMEGKGVLVAIVDTGINMAYLNGKGKNPTFDIDRSWVPRAGLTPGSLPVSHGTMCAFDVCIAAPQCTLLDIALLQSNKQGGTVMEGLLSDAVKAYRHLYDIMYRANKYGRYLSMVVNNSWGMFHPSWDYPIGDPGNYSDNPNHPFNQIVGTLERVGADILFAAGNCGKDCPDGRCQGVTERAIYGANSHPQVLCVAGVDVDKNRVGYSSIGPGRLAKRKPDLSGYTHFAGSGVYPADGGTSAATPVVAGVVAAVRSKVPHNPNNPDTSPAAMRDAFNKTAEDRGATGYDFEYGWGIVNGCKLSSILCRKPDEPEEDKCKCHCHCCCCCHCHCHCHDGDCKEQDHECGCGEKMDEPEG